MPTSAGWSSTVIVAATSTAPSAAFDTGSKWSVTSSCVRGRPALSNCRFEGLRVADASVMPIIPSANTNATVLAIAEGQRR